MLKPIIISVLVVAVISTECLLAWMLIPSTTQVETWAKSQTPADGKMAAEKPEGGQKEAGDASKTASDKTEDKAPEEAEVDLGKFGVVVHKPAEEVTLRVNFHLVGIVAANDSPELTPLVEKTKHRLRDQVIYEIRNAETADLTDPGLGLIKRRILAKTNELFGKPHLKSIVFSEYTFLEQ